MNDLPAKAKRKRKLGVAPTKPQFVPGCTHFAPKCTQCKTKGLLQNESLKLYHYLSYFPPKDTDMDSMSVSFLFAVMDLEIADTGCIPCKYADAAVHLARGNDLLRGVAVACVSPLRKIL